VLCCAVLCCAVQEERETLREQLCAVPAEADPTGIAINVAKVCWLVALVLAAPHFRRSYRKLQWLTKSDRAQGNITKICHRAIRMLWLFAMLLAASLQRLRLTRRGPCFRLLLLLAAVAGP
jgi:hypothetical protein